MRATDRFIARVDAAAPETLTPREIRTRLELLAAELEQLDHDQEHVDGETCGTEHRYHVAKIDRERSEALEKKTRFTALLGTKT